MFELWPTSTMCYEQKINAVTRFIVLLTILGYILTSSNKIIIVGIFTLVGIGILYSMRKQKVTKSSLENFDVQQRTKEEPMLTNPVTLESVLKSEFKEGNKKNPFSNVLLTQINDEPERKSAPPSFNMEVDKDITTNVKRAVQMLNPGIKSASKQLYGDLWQEFELDKSNHQFYSTANSRVSNDQTALGNYLYGNMPSSKESGPESAMARIQDSYRYTLY